jgi:transketolase
MTKINELKKQIVLAAHAAGSGHIPSAFSILDIVWTLYDKILKPEDRFILSKGHGCLALYAVLVEKGYFPKEQLMTFAKHDSILGGHPDRNKIPGVIASTGSLGHGLPMAVGVALAKKIKKQPGRVFCLVGDGEMNEGSCWEACLLAAHHKLDNLIIFVDYNYSTDRALTLDNLKDKFYHLSDRRP